MQKSLREKKKIADDVMKTFPRSGEEFLLRARDADSAEEMKEMLEKFEKVSVFRVCVRCGQCKKKSSVTRDTVKCLCRAGLKFEKSWKFGPSISVTRK